MKKKLSIFSLIFVTFLAAVNGVSTDAQTISGSINKDSVRRGRRAASGQIILKIPAELHVNSHKPNDEFTVPTTVKFNDSNVKVSKIIYPKGILRKFKFSETALSVYQGRVIFPFTFSVPANLKSNEIRINAMIEFQACNEEVCFPPKRKKITLTARIK